MSSIYLTVTIPDRYESLHFADGEAQAQGRGVGTAGVLQLESGRARFGTHGFPVCVCVCVWGGGGLALTSSQRPVLHVFPNPHSVPSLR